MIYSIYSIYILYIYSTYIYNVSNYCDLQTENMSTILDRSDQHYEYLREIPQLIAYKTNHFVNIKFFSLELVSHLEKPILAIF